jgi:hypothetical protein
VNFFALWANVVASFNLSIYYIKSEKNENITSHWTRLLEYPSLDPPVGVEGSRRESRAIGIVSSKTFLSKTNFFSQHMFSLPAHVPVEVGGLRPGIKKKASQPVTTSYLT